MKMKTINRAITAAFCVMTACILLLILFAFETTTFSGKMNFALPQWMITLGGLGALLAVYAAVENAYAIAAYPELSILDNAYFSHCPNNIVLTLLDANLMRLFRAVVGDAGIERCVYVLIAAQCAVSACTGWLTQWVARNATGSRRFSWAVAAGYVLLVSASPWVTIPYSDGFALLFPMLTLALYIRQRTAKRKKSVRKATIRIQSPSAAAAHQRLQSSTKGKSRRRTAGRVPSALSSRLKSRLRRKFPARLVCRISSPLSGPKGRFSR